MTIYTDANTIRSASKIKTGAGVEVGPYNDSGTIRSATTPKRTQEGIEHTDAGTVRSKCTVVGADHYCTFIPVFVFSGLIHYDEVDAINKLTVLGANRYTWFVELNPQANPC